MSKHQAISLHLVSSKDVPTLVDIHYEAFANDALMKLMYGSHDDTESIVSDLREALKDPTARFTKAVDETDHILGWSWWNLYLDAETHLEAAKTTEEEQKQAPKGAISPETFLQYHAAVNDRRRKWITGKPGSILQAIAVRPKFQGRGIGTALVKAGLEEASRNRLLAWLEASSVGLSLYEKCGFRHVGEAIESLGGVWESYNGLHDAWAMMHNLGATSIVFE